MKSKVYFIPVKESDNHAVIAGKLEKLLAASKVLDFLSSGKSAAVKLHFGEEGNTGFVKAEFVKAVCVGIRAKGAKPFVSDTNTLYKGKRANSKDHLALAIEHGFTRQNLGADIIIPDDTQKENMVDLPINRKLVKVASLARCFVEADAIVAVSHFKGHIMTSFGGALKNLGMGCASRKGKLVQHGEVSPVVYKDKCIGCGQCVEACPVDAIVMNDKRAQIDPKKCIGCATCIAVCPSHAIDVPWSAGEATIQDKMIEYTSAVLKGKEGQSAFINFAIKITKECDCLAQDDPRVAPDLGILASNDPVAVDKACFDLVNKSCGRDIFKELHPQRDSTRQLVYAAELGLGSLEYELAAL